MSDLFLSTITNKIDKKGRVSVPHSFRTVLHKTQGDSDAEQSSLVLFRSLNHPCLEGCSSRFLQTLNKDSTGWVANKFDDFAEVIFADSHLITLDSEGRMSLPTEFSEYAQITDQIAFVGRGSRFQIWNPKTFKNHHNATRERLSQQRDASHG